MNIYEYLIQVFHSFNVFHNQKQIKGGHVLYNMELNSTLTSNFESFSFEVIILRHTVYSSEALGTIR